MTGAAFTYIASSSFVLHGTYGVSPQTFSAIFAINAMSLVLATQANGLLLAGSRPGGCCASAWRRSRPARWCWSRSPPRDRLRAGRRGPALSLCLIGFGLNADAAARAHAAPALGGGGRRARRHPALLGRRGVATARRARGWRHPGGPRAADVRLRRRRERRAPAAAAPRRSARDRRGPLRGVGRADLGTQAATSRGSDATAVQTSCAASGWRVKWTGSATSAPVHSAASAASRAFIAPQTLMIATRGR